MTEDQNDKFNLYERHGAREYGPTASRALEGFAEEPQELFADLE